MTHPDPGATAFSNEAEPFSTDVIDSIAGRVGVLDENDCFIAVNRAWKSRSAALGLPTDYPLGYHLHDLTGGIAKRYGHILERGYLAVVEGRRSEFSCAYPVPTRGEDDWFKQSFTRMVGDGPARCIVIIQSIQELKRAERRLRTLNDSLFSARNLADQANRAKSVFLALMSHEMRTPLNGVLGMAQVMALGELPDAQRRNLDLIRKCGATLLGLVTDLLDLSNLEAGGIELEHGVIEAEHLAEYARASCRALLQEKNVGFEVGLAADEAPLWVGDDKRVRQVLHTLLSNAAKFTERGQIDVQMAYRDGRLSLRVQDTGVGIPAAKLESIFETFVQADASFTRRHNGAGLGLAICRKLVALMGGQIEVESVEHVGTTFTVTLPTRPAEPQNSPEPHPPKRRTSSLEQDAIRLNRSDR